MATYVAAPVRILGVDWSGAKSGSRRRIWLAEVIGGRCTRLESGRSREELADELAAMVVADSRVVVGFDFAFSAPAWFLEDRGFPHVRDLWSAAERDAENWLAACDPPLWGRPKVRRPSGIEHFRRTDVEDGTAGAIRAKSVFQIGGAGAVGTGSIRGWPILERLRSNGFSIWPFDPVALPLVVEIYPRVLTGAVNKSDPEGRVGWLDRSRFPVEDEHRLAVEASEDAFDALASAIVMAAHLDELLSLAPARDRVDRLEGRIWRPRNT